MQLHACRAFNAGVHQVDDDRPYPAAEIGGLHDGADLDGEEPAAVAAATGHPLVLGVLLYIDGTAGFILLNLKDLHGGQRFS